MGSGADLYGLQAAETHLYFRSHPLRNVWGPAYRLKVIAVSQDSGELKTGDSSAFEDSPLLVHLF